MSHAEEKLAALGLALPVAAAPVANYVGFTVSGNTVPVGPAALQGRRLPVTGPGAAFPSSRVARPGACAAST
jgi:hypothetical protein